MKSLEYEEAQFGDKRLNDRYKQLLDRAINHPNDGIINACRGGSEVQAAYRFFHNEKVTSEELLGGHYIKTADRVRLEKRVLLIQDTTAIMYTGREKIKGMGIISDETQQGFLCHPLLALTPERVPLGLVECCCWNRESLKKSTPQERRELPIEEKESYRWIKMIEAARELKTSCPGTELIMVGDRENDIYDFMKADHPGDWIIRAGHNRRTEEERLLFDTLCDAPVIGHCHFVYRPSAGALAKKVVQEVRRAQLCIKAPTNSKPGTPSQQVTALYCRQINTTAGQTPLQWILLTSLPATTLEDCMQIILYYGCRWEIEIFFKILKSGCHVEQLQFTSFIPLWKCVAFYMIVAWHIHYCCRIGRACPNLPCELLFAPNEWKLAYAAVHKSSPPTEVPSLKACLTWIAELGGYLPRKSASPPGPKVMWRGFTALSYVVQGAEIAHLVP